MNGVFLDRDLGASPLFSIATSPDVEGEADVASDQARSVIVYRRLASESPYNGAGRIMFRLFDREAKFADGTPVVPWRQRAVRR